MTVTLILACLAIAGAELYMARSARQTANRLKRLESIARLHDQRIQSMTPNAGDPAAGSGRHLATGPPPVPSPPGAAPLASAGAGAGAGAGAELTRLTTETQRLGGRLDGLEQARDTQRRLHARVDDAVDSLERLVGEVVRHTVGQLDEAVAQALGGGPADLDPGSGTVRGVLCRAARGPCDPLVRAYERCAGDTGLRIRFRLPGTGEPWHARYYLAGRDPRGLERDFLALLDGMCSPAVTPEQTAFHGLLRSLGDLPAGFAQIGPMVAARVPDALLCGVLTLTETRGFDAEALVGDPPAVLTRLRGLPAERVRDLTMWASSNGPGPDLGLSAAPQH